jgi:hypothetical protein
VWEDKSDDVDTRARLFTLEARRLRTSEWVTIRDKVVFAEQSSILECNFQQNPPKPQKDYVWHTKTLLKNF